MTSNPSRAQLRALSNEHLRARMQVLEDARLVDGGTDNWFLNPVHPSYARYQVEVRSRQRTGDPFWPQPFAPQPHDQELPW